MMKLDFAEFIGANTAFEEVAILKTWSEERLISIGVK